MSSDATFLAISDIHLDPFDGLSSTDAKKLVTTAAAGWPDLLLNRASSPTLPGFKKDANYALFDDTLAHAQKTCPKPDFILYPGDFVRHDMWHSWGAPHKLGLSTSDAETIILKIVELTFARFDHYFPNVPVLMTFGNDDSYVDDYGLVHDGKFLKDLEPLCRKALGTAVDDAGFSSFVHTGSYVATLPKLEHRLLSISNVFWSNSYTGDNANGDAVITWLDDQLSATPSNGKSGKDCSWLMMHIPPGRNGYYSCSGLDSGPNWHTHFEHAYEATLNKHDVPIDVAFTGHTHMDDFRFLTHKRASKPAVLMHKIVPAVSPKFGNNPAFLVCTTKGGVIDDWTTHYRDGNAPTDHHWGSTHSYSAKTDYGYTTPSDLLVTFRQMVSPGSKPRAAYEKDYKARASTVQSSHIDAYIQIAIAKAAGYSPALAHIHDDAVTVEEAAAGELADVT